VHFSRPSIDVLMESAADAYGPNLAGIVLTGANADGARGLARIGQQGGLSVVQDPAEASMAAMPEAAISLVGFKSGLTDRLQVGFRTSPDLLFGLTDHEGGLMVVAAIVGVNLKYQLYKSKDSSFSFNYVFPIVELVYSSFNGPNSFTMAGGTSVISLLMSSSEEQYRDFFVRTGFQKRLSPGLTMVLEAGFYEMLPNSDALAFVNAALRIGGESIYLDLMAGATNYWGFGGMTLGIAY
jgi:hypothetical protein